MGICPKVNVIARLEYELAYYDFEVHRFNHYTTRTPPHLNSIESTSNPVLMYLHVFSAAIYRIKFKDKHYNTTVWIMNAQFLRSNYVHVKVTLLLQYKHLWWWLKIGQEVQGRFLNQFPPDIIKSIWQLERIG